jgi:pimeloyl-ACP methyl ester carboxylesterase
MAGRQVRFRNDRLVGLTGLGDPLADRLVLLCHPTAGAAGFDPDPVLTSTWGIHLMSFDRAGYGASDPYPADENPSAAAWADDVADYLRRVEGNAAAVEHTEFGRIGVIGWREGGLFAAALAARHPDLVDRLALVGCPALPTLADSAAAKPAPESWLDPARLTLHISAHDTGTYERRINHMLAEAQLQGTAGIDADLACFANELPNLSTVTALALVAVGRHDEADLVDADWFCEQLPHSERVISEQGGRDLIASSWQRVLEHVAPAHGHVNAIAAQSH